MKILVCSDTHGDTVYLRRIRLMNQGCDLYLHCGDACISQDECMDFIVCKGNCDFYPFPLTRDLPTKWGVIHMEHGNNYRAHYKEYIESLHCFIFLSGHTHVKEAGYDGNTYLFNPGSLTEPEDGSYGSYLLINIDEETGKLSYEFKDQPV
jgi:putative phosphoesterase